MSLLMALLSSFNRLVPCPTVICRTERRGWRRYRRRRGQRIRRGYPLHPRAGSQRDGGPAGCTGAHAQSLVLFFLYSITFSEGTPELHAHRPSPPLQPPGTVSQEASQLPLVLPLIPISHPGLQLQCEERGQGFFRDRHVC